MYKVEKKKYGYLLTLGGFMNLEEIENWRIESIEALNSAPKEFGVLVDMRSLKPLPAECQEKVGEVQKLYKSKGMSRSAVILESPITTMQFKRFAKESGIYQWERYIDSSIHENPETIGIKWIEDEIDPDK